MEKAQMRQFGAFTRNSWQGKGHADGFFFFRVIFLFTKQIEIHDLRETFADFPGSKNTVIIIFCLFRLPLDFRFFVLHGSENRQVDLRCRELTRGVWSRINLKTWHALASCIKSSVGSWFLPAQVPLFRFCCPQSFPDFPGGPEFLLPCVACLCYGFALSWGFGSCVIRGKSRAWLALDA